MIQLLKRLTRKVKPTKVTEVHCIIEPMSDCGVETMLEEFLFSVAKTGKPCIPRIKQWLDTEYPKGYRILDLWIPEPFEE